MNEQLRFGLLAHAGQKCLIRFSVERNDDGTAKRAAEEGRNPERTVLGLREIRSASVKPVELLLSPRYPPLGKMRSSFNSVILCLFVSS